MTQPAGPDSADWQPLDHRCRKCDDPAGHSPHRRGRARRRADHARVREGIPARADPPGHGLCHRLSMKHSTPAPDVRARREGAWRSATCVSCSLSCLARSRSGRDAPAAIWLWFWCECAARCDGLTAGFGVPRRGCGAGRPVGRAWGQAQAATSAPVDRGAVPGSAVVGDCFVFGLDATVDVYSRGVMRPVS